MEGRVLTVLRTPEQVDAGSQSYLGVHACVRCLEAGLGRRALAAWGPLEAKVQDRMDPGDHRKGPVPSQLLSHPLRRGLARLMGGHSQEGDLQ